MIDLAGDLEAMLSTDDFAVAGSYTPAGGAAVTVNGILDRPSALGLSGEFGGVSVREPVFSCREVDLPAGATDGDELVAGGVTFTVRTIEPDGTGLARVILELSA